MARADAAILAMQSVSRSLRELAKVPARAAKAAAVELETVIRAQEDAETDPYDRPWKPLAASTVAKKGGDTRILRDSDVMLDSLEVKPMAGSGLSITFDPPYTAFHQIGTKDMPARPVLPTGPLPRSWSDALERAAQGQFDAWADGARR